MALVFPATLQRKSDSVASEVGTAVFIGRTGSSGRGGGGGGAAARHPLGGSLGLATKTREDTAVRFTSRQVVFPK